MLGACGPDITADTPPDGSTSTTSMPWPPATSSASSDSTSGDAADDTTSGIGFIPSPDLPPDAFQCDRFEQDCPQGEKCTLWAYDGGTTYNGLRCVPVADDPAGWEEPCTVTPPVASGVDDCELGAFCWDGLCKPFCQGGLDNPTCPDGYYCPISASGGLLICRLHCDPLGSDCPEDAPCTPTGETFDCLPDAGAGAASVGDPCEAINACGAAKICMSAEVWPGCRGEGCCAPYCDITNPDADAECDAAGPGTVCVPWHPPGEAPPHLQHVGVCRTP